MIQQADNFPDQLDHLISVFLAEGRGPALQEMEPISYRPEGATPRLALSRSQTLTIFQRDGWVCRYCLGRTIFTPVMALLGSIFPDDFPYHRNWKAGVTHPAVISRSAAIDHVQPGSHAGRWTDPSNLVTACWPCNQRKGDLTLDQLGWCVQPVPAGARWDGLTDSYPQLWEAGGRPNQKLMSPGSHSYGRQATRPRLFSS